MKLFLLIICGILFVSCSNKETAQNIDIFKKYNTKGTIVLKNLTTDTTIIYNQKRSQEQFSPASTFKILNSLILLKENIIGVDDTIKWDKVNRSKSWDKDFTMKTAFNASCVWFYQELSRRLTKETYQKYLSEINYGNKTISKEIDNFWLDNSLKISAIEQVEFLTKVVDYQLPFDTLTVDKLKEIMITDANLNFVWFTKTGWAQSIGWFEGFIQTKKAVWVFALNIDMPNIEMAPLRQEIVYEVLKKEGVL